MSVVAGGHTILENLDVRIEAGSHVAIVGPSGAGKSTFVGALLGWHRPSAGRVLVDGEPLDAGRLQRLRNETVWLDPSVQLWNTSLLENLSYGANGDALAGIGDALEDANLHPVVDRLPIGLQSTLGEHGGLLSGGEGQRVRVGRAMLRRVARLVIIDEPFRGLDRDQRRELLARVRRIWSGATLLCITHDLQETLGFDRVLVLERGRLVEDGAPALLSQTPGSAYATLLGREEEIQRSSWANPVWRHLWMRSGELGELGKLSRPSLMS